MIAPQAASVVDPGASRDAIRANQLIEAGLWLHLGGDNTGARSLFTRALVHDPANRRARELLARSEPSVSAAPAALQGAPPPAVRPLTAPPVQAPEAPRPALEVSVVLLDEAAEAPAEERRLITADVLSFLSEPEFAPEALKPAAPAPEARRPAPPVPEAPRSGAPAQEARRAVTPAPVAPRPGAPVQEARRAVTPAPVAPRPLTPLPVLVPRMEPLQEVPTLLQGVTDLLSLGDVSSAMALLSKAEQLAPGDARLAEARERCSRQQLAALEARLGDLKRVPSLKLRMAELMKLRLDPRAGFLLSRVDGRLSYEALFAVSGMSRLDTLSVLVQLLDQDIITVR